MTLTLHADVRGITAPRTVVVDGLTVAPRSGALDTALALAEDQLRRPDAVRDEAMSRTRAMYRRLGIDPTRTRPSSEALLRRLRKGDRLPSINNLVDVVNWCSVESQVPFGLYDRQSIGADLTVRLGQEGEGYDGIRKDRVNVAGRLVVADAEGAFGNPTSDSARAMITDATRAVLVVLFLPADTPAGAADLTVRETRQRLAEYGAPAQ